MLTDDMKSRITGGLTYDEYTRFINEHIDRLTGKPGDNFSKLDLLRLNNARSRRIEKTFLPDEEFISAVNSIREKQTWLMITEPWCGDSAQVIPFFAKAAELNPNINFRLILRDKNPDIMELYLTNGTRSIPLLAAFDENWNELFRWGSRPKPAKDLVLQLKESGVSKAELNEKLHSWYALNKGKSITFEICEILRTQLAPEML